jgi:hypothetical protein
MRTHELKKARMARKFHRLLFFAGINEPSEGDFFTTVDKSFLCVKKLISEICVCARDY